ncbi:uncharacterized protein LY89DRAFT_674456 [Mollisia scopiformis]|uniref:Uncharacterized protein n=1 Tax=Mollisia scopiformis TaxID=149040 RepID=A0A194WT23_MOLSC|nr:uncharacterized protein LY89DRAFT_674456 [Mollisia scopiformis]KUJ11106.1 hypothetical protein LY89DRAFT_674456 [Mollisia scopiformis]
MPPRRSHKKSKAGCQRCKNRKIKHGVPCDFEGPISPNTAATPTTPVFFRQDTVESSSHMSSFSTPRTTASAIVPFYHQPPSLIRANQTLPSSRALELKLMHHFTARTCLTFSDGLEQNMAWQVDIPTIAYDAQYLMDAILAVSALHMRVMYPEDRSLIRASHGYMASALAQYSSLLTQGVSELNSEALFSTSALIAFQASASRLFDEDGPYSLPLAWFHSFQGVKTVVMASWRWLRTSNKIFPIINSQPALFLDLDPERKHFFAPLLDDLEEHLQTFPESLRMETKQAYLHAVAFLNWAHRRPVRNRILGFAAAVSRRYVDLVAQHDPRVLVITACFFALTKMVDDVWWLNGIAKREVNGICSLLPSDWWPKLDWPLRIANHEGPMDDETWGSSLSELHSLKKEENNVHEHIDLLAQIINESNPPLD